MANLDHFAWPFVVLVAVLMFRQPLSAFVSSASGRISKFKAFNVEIELASGAKSTPLLDDIRSIANAADINESKSALVAQIQVNEPVDYALINLGAGEDWIASRLYLAAVMMERMRRLQAFVFVDGTERNFVALASVRQTRWALAQYCPWLEAAWVRANLRVFHNYEVEPPDVHWIPDPRTLFPARPPIGPASPLISEFGAIEPDRAVSVIRHFLSCLQAATPAPANPPATPAPTPMDLKGEAARPDWTALGNGISERAPFVTRKLLKSLLSPAAFEAWAPDLRDAPRARQTRAILRRKGDFVALLDSQHRLMRVANRRALLEDVGADLGAEPEA